VRFANLPVIAPSKLAKHFFHPPQNCTRRLQPPERLKG
jgi:hypothetical protein